MYKNISDQQLVSDYIRGNEQSFEILIKRHKDRIFNYILKTLRDKDLANDVFQDTFIKVINTLKTGKYNEEGKFLPWVMRIAHNLMIDHFRKEKKMPKVGKKVTSGEDTFDIFSVLKLEDSNIEDKMVLDQIHSDVRKLVDFLPEEQREVIVMRHYQDMSFKEISEKSNVSINTALGRMRYALINLRKIIEEHNMILTEY